MLDHFYLFFVMSNDLAPHLWKPGQSANPKGRPKGIQDKFSILQAKAVAARGITPLEFMMAVVRKDPTELASLSIKERDITLALRMKAAEAAMPYCHRKMPQGVEVKTGQLGTYTPEQLAALDPAELDEMLRITGKLQEAADEAAGIIDVDVNVQSTDA